MGSPFRRGSSGALPLLGDGVSILTDPPYRKWEPYRHQNSVLAFVRQGWIGQRGSTAVKLFLSGRREQVSLKRGFLKKERKGSQSWLYRKPQAVS